MINFNTFNNKNSNIQIKLENINNLKLYQAQNEFTIFAMNIRSIKKNFDLLVSEIETYKVDIDIIFLTEIWGNGIKETFYKIPGYKQQSHTNFLNMAGGVIIYYKQSLNITFEKSHFKAADSLIGNLYIENKTIKILALYRSPSLPVEIQ
jgi:exonuclease III